MTEPFAAIAPPAACPRCGTGLAPGLLRCPACRSLAYADTLARLSAEASEAAAEGRLAEAAGRWHAALSLLPADAAQRPAIERRLEELGARMERGEGRRTAQPSAGRGSVWAAAGAGVLFLITKGKVLLLALTKGGALLSLFAFLGLYWREWGWALAAGLVVSIYLHELGHVVSLWRYRIPVSAPMFVPGIGAYVRHGVLPTARIGARVALAGPLAGLLTALAALALGALTGDRYWGAIAHLGAILNLFNLVPVWQLDGARAVAPLARSQRLVYGLLLAAVAAASRDPFAVIVALTTAGALVFLPRSRGEDRGAVLQAAAIILGLGAVLLLDGGSPL